MITTVLIAAHGEWTERLRTILAKHGTVLVVTPDDPSDTLAPPLAGVVDVVVLEAELLTDKVISTLHQVQAMYPNSVTVCVAREETAEQARIEGLLSPDFWVIVPASELQLRTQIESIMAFVTAGGHRALSPISSPSTGLGSGHPRMAKSLRRATPDGYLESFTYAEPMRYGGATLYRMVGRMTSSFDLDHLFTAYCEAIQEATRCVSYCLLWSAKRPSVVYAPSPLTTCQEFTIVRAEGLPPVLQNVCRLLPTDPLPAWLQQTRGVVTKEALLENSHQASVLRELEMCGGVLAIPLFCQGVLRGIMVVGPKAVGKPYTPAEAEALFVLSASAAAAARQSELHQELEARNNYIAQVLCSMESGVITLGLDAKIRVCNPYAANVLRLNSGLSYQAEGVRSASQGEVGTTCWQGHKEIVGRDLRVLPSPLGDYLYACLTYGEELSHQEVAVFGGQVLLQVSTRRLVDSQGALIGSMMLLEDISAQRALTEERRRAERNEVISQIVARFAHELKNPLATIHTFLELLPTRSEDPEFRQFCSEHVKRDVHRLDDLAAKLVSLCDRDALAHSAYTGQQVLEIPELIRLAIARVELLDQDAPAYITSKLDSNLPKIRVDANAMAAALCYLLRYGLHHGTPRGEFRGRNHVSIEAKLQDGPEGEQPVAIFIKAPDATLPSTPQGQDKQRHEYNPQLLLDPSYVLDHPDIDLGPSASQRLIERQGGALEAYYEEVAPTVSFAKDYQAEEPTQAPRNIVFRISLIPVPSQLPLIN